VEAEARDNNFSHEQRYASRQEKSVPVLADIKIWLDENLIEALPKSLTGKAISYMLGRWKALARYLDDGCYEIDNNLVENAIRPVALGRKNYLFAGSHNGAKRMAQVYSLVATAKMQGIEPMAYLKETLSKLPDWPVKKVEELLPILNSPEQI
jgi:transposase